MPVNKHWLFRLQLPNAELNTQLYPTSFPPRKDYHFLNGYKPLSTHPEILSAFPVKHLF